MKKNVYKPLFAAILLFSALVLAATHVGELRHFLTLLHNIAPIWVIVALLFQLGTYISLALVWHRSLRYSGVCYPLHQLIPLAIAKLFADQAVPSVGISGIAFIVNAFTARNISRQVGLSIMLLSILSYYAAFALVAVASLLILLAYHHIHQWMVVIAGIFFTVAIAVPGAILFLKKSGVQEKIPEWLSRIPIISGMLSTYADAPDEVLHKPSLLVEAIFFQITVFLLDSATLWAMLYALGNSVSLLLAFPCFVLASMVAMLSLIPLGLGSFEATCVGLLVMLGIKLDTALTATLLLRGFTLWFPMIPGLILTRKSLG